MEEKIKVNNAFKIKNENMYMVNLKWLNIVETKHGLNIFRCVVSCYMVRESCLLFGFVGTEHTMELRLFATLQPLMPQQILFVLITPIAPVTRKTW